MKFHENYPVGAKLLHMDRWVDRYDEANSRSLQFCKHAEGLGVYIQTACMEMQVTHCSL